MLRSKVQTPSDPFTDRFAYETIPSTSRATAKQKGGVNGEANSSSKVVRSVKISRPGRRGTPPALRRVAQLLGVVGLVTCVAILALGTSPQSHFGAQNSEATPPIAPFDSGPIHLEEARARSILDLPSPPSPAFSIPTELEAYVQRLVSSAMRDPVGLQDFALHALGAKVLPQLTTQARGRWQGSSPRSAPEEALRDSLHVGQCWLVKGTSAQLGVALHNPVYPSHITIDHIPLEIAPDVGQAPRRMLVWGLVEGKNNLGLYHELLSEHAQDLYPADLGRRGPPVSGRARFVLLADIEYNIFAPFHIQTYPIRQAIVDAGFYFGIVVLEILNNWGGETTCLYRVRVHGHKLPY